MKTYTAFELISAAHDWLADDAARMASRPLGMPRAMWRAQNPARPLPAFDVRDTAYKTRPSRTLGFDANGNLYDLWVWSVGAAPRVIERINLRAQDADARLGRYIAAE